MFDLRAGVYRHVKGEHYLVIGYAHDANADTLGDVTAVEPLGFAKGFGIKPLGERAVVVYIPLYLNDDHTGPRMAVRTVENFFEWVCDVWTEDAMGHRSWPCWRSMGSGSLPGLCPDHGAQRARQRFVYIGPTWEGER